MRTMCPPLTRIGGVAVAIGFLSACSGGMQSQIAPSTGASDAVTSNALAKGGLSPFAYRGLMPATRPNHHPSWIAPDAKKGGNALLYVSNLGTADVTIYTYKKNGLSTSLVGTLTGFTEPGAPCADNNGNVYVPDIEASVIYEFAHGATSPSQVLTDPAGSPISCSYDLSTGNLAVANFGMSNSNGSVAIFPKATGTPTVMPANNVSHPAFVGYLPSGTLYADGVDSNDAFQMAVMPSGKSSFSPVTISGATIYSPGAILWGGSYLLVGDQRYLNQSTSAVYQMCICSSTSLQKQGQAPIAGSSDVLGYWKRGAKASARIIAPDLGNSANGVIIDNPNTQKTTANITDGVSEPVGATISQRGSL